MADRLDPYKMLQVDPEADPDVIQAAYRRLAQKYHPDVAPGPEAAERMKAINVAWDILADPLRRAAHDRERAGAQAAGGRPDVSGPAGASANRGSPVGWSSAAGSSVTRPPQEVSRDWTAGRSWSGSGYDPSSMRSPDGEGAAGPPPGKPTGSVLNFGRYAGWSLGEIARVDLTYLEWLDRMPIGRLYRGEIDAILRQTSRRRSADVEKQRRGLFRR
jgi:curved DNA-binding protein CbpA